MDEELPENSPGAKNLGYVLLMRVYYELEIDKFLKNMSQYRKFEYNVNSIMLLMVVSRILSPGSIKRTFENKGRYFERFDFTDDDIYRSYDFFDEVSAALQRYAHESVRAKYGSDTSIIYYDVTNYWFEIKKPDEMRKRGLCKQRRRKPIVQMGLAMNKDGIPLHYEIFPGNTLDKETFRTVIGQVRRNYDTGRIIAVADMGIITGDNIYYLVGPKPEKPQNGYIFSFTVRGGTQEFKQYVLNEKGYTNKDGSLLEDNYDFKIKERFIARDINVTMQNGKKQKKKVYEKQIVFCSKKHMQKQRAERNEILKRSADLVINPDRYTKATTYGAAAYVKNLEYDKSTGEVLTEKVLILDVDKIEEEEKYDGFYSIVTSEKYMDSGKIVGTYRGLWEIEETFQLTKSDLLARPVYVREKEHINAHFLICFLALTIMRLIQKRINRQYSPEKIIECLNAIECMHESENIFLFNYRSPLSDLLGDTFGFNFRKKRLYRSELKNFSASSKIS
jgi:transposase